MFLHLRDHFILDTYISPTLFRQFLLVATWLILKIRQKGESAKNKHIPFVPLDPLLVSGCLYQIQQHGALLGYGKGESHGSEAAAEFLSLGNDQTHVLKKAYVWQQHVARSHQVQLIPQFAKSDWATSSNNVQHFYHLEIV
jgi:hypothetical protein